MVDLTETSAPTPGETTVTLPDEAQVIAYLNRDPLLLTSHPQLLEQIEITHAAGSAVSLIERQVDLLRG
ncbi:DUF484 family protein, partial [Nevskia ramosa]|uniref:DUF484 family protein n=1 Tax=Nevskia ramosa TaxID=64002 RepID=UPI0023548968